MTNTHKEKLHIAKIAYKAICNAIEAVESHLEADITIHWNHIITVDGYVFMSTDLKDGWISVKDRLPNDDEYVLVYHAHDFHITVGFFEISNVQYYIESDGSKFYTDDGWETQISWAPKGRVTHWMPLPKPPNELLNDSES